MPGLVSSVLSHYKINSIHDAATQPREDCRAPATDKRQIVRVHARTSITPSLPHLYAAAVCMVFFSSYARGVASLVKNACSLSMQMRCVKECGTRDGIARDENEECLGGRVECTVCAGMISMKLDYFCYSRIVL